jgi:hypothetical protein
LSHLAHPALVLAIWIIAIRNALVCQLLLHILRLLLELRLISALKALVNRVLHPLPVGAIVRAPRIGRILAKPKSALVGHLVEPATCGAIHLVLLALISLLDGLLLGRQCRGLDRIAGCIRAISYRASRPYGAHSVCVYAGPVRLCIDCALVLRDLCRLHSARQARICRRWLLHSAR